MDKYQAHPVRIGVTLVLLYSYAGFCEDCPAVETVSWISEEASSELEATRPHLDGITPISVADVTLCGEMDRRIRMTAEKNLLSLDQSNSLFDIFVRPFEPENRESFDANRLGHYVGTGKIMEGLVRLSAYLDDERVIKVKQRCIDTLLNTQDKDGYLGWADDRGRFKFMWVMHEAAYLIHAFLAEYEYYDSKRSLKAAEALANWIIEHADECYSGVSQKIGLPTAFVRLAKATGDQKYLQWLKDSVGTHRWEGWSQTSMEPTHVYTCLERALAQVQLRTMKANVRLEREGWKGIRDNLFVRGGLLIPGTCTGLGEHWNYRQKGEKHGETCATVYLLKFMHGLMQLEPDSLYGDVMERVIHNGLSAAQSPDGCQIRYHTPFTGPREYWPHEHYCCPNNFRRMMGLLPELAYYRHKHGLVINLFETSEVSCNLEGSTVTVSQNTNYPSEGKVLLRVDPARPTSFSLHLRIPGWCREASIAVNGETAQKAAGGQYFEIRRRWSEDDVVELDMPMEWRWVKGRQLQAGKVALLRGPVVFGLNPSNVSGYRHSEKIESHDFERNFVLNTATLGEAFQDDTIRPNGRTVTVRAWSPWTPMTSPTDVELKLTEFPDPKMVAVYFLTTNKDESVRDELLDYSAKPLAE